MFGAAGLAAQGHLLAFRSVRHIRRHGEAGSARKLTAPPICRANCSVQCRARSSAAIKAGWATSRLGAGGSNAARRSSARASNAARSAASSNRLAWRRGRTIWRKPKPLTAVRSNGCGRIASIASATALRAALPRVSAGRCRSIRRCRGGGWLGRRPRRRARASSLGGKLSVDVDQGHRRRRLKSRSSPPGKPDDAAARFFDEVGPAEASRWSACAHRPPWRLGASPIGPSARASGRFHGSAPPIASRSNFDVSRRLRSPPERPWAGDIPAAGSRHALRPRRRPAGRRGSRRPAMTPSRRMRASRISSSVDQRGPGLADPTAR